MAVAGGTGGPHRSDPEPARRPAGGLATPRLRLTPVTRQDVPELHDLLTDPRVRRWLLDDAVVGVEWVEEEVGRSEALFEELGLEGVRAATDLPNVASIRVMERLGMAREREDPDEGPEGTAWYSLPRPR